MLTFCLDITNCQDSVQLGRLLQRRLLWDRCQRHTLEAWEHQCVQTMPLRTVRWCGQQQRTSEDQFHGRARHTQAPVMQTHKAHMRLLRPDGRSNSTSVEWTFAVNLTELRDLESAAGKRVSQGLRANVFAFGTSSIAPNEMQHRQQQSRWMRASNSPIFREGFFDLVFDSGTVEQT